MPRKRANGQGSIYRDRTNNRWVAALVIGRRPNGTLIRKKFTGRTRAEVERRLEDAKRALHFGLAIPDDKITVGAYLRWWAAEVLPTEGLAPATTVWYQRMVRLLLPHVHNRTLVGPRALTPGDVEMICATARTPRTARAMRATLSKALAAAERDGLVGRNVARLARPRRDGGQARPNRALTAAEVAELLNALEGTRWHVVALVGVTTGLRPGELLGLCWEDVHLDIDPHVVVRRAMSWVGGPHLKGPKRERSYRRVPLTPEAVAALRTWRRQQAAERLAAGPLWRGDRWPDLVFTRPDGTPYPETAYRRALADALPGISPHRLRHTFCTHLLENGVPIHVVAELAGDSVDTIEATYSHHIRVKTEVAAVARGLVAGMHHPGESNR